MKIDINEIKSLIKEEYNRFIEEEVYEIEGLDEELYEVEFIDFEDKGDEWYEKNNPIGKFEKIGSHIKESVSKKNLERVMRSEIESRIRPDDDSLSLKDIEEISQEYGVDEEDIIEYMQSYLLDRSKERMEDLKYWVSECIAEMRDEEIGINYGEFKKFFRDKKYEDEVNWASMEEIKKEFLNQTNDPNQLKLDLKESFNTNQVLSEEIKRMKGLINY